MWTACCDSVGIVSEKRLSPFCKEYVVEKFPQVEPSKVSDVLKVVSERIGDDGREEVRLQFVK